jgi:arsenate reductase
MAATIYHNPRCSTSRKVLEAIRAHGVEPEIVLYLETPPDRAVLTGLLARAGLTAGDILRRKEPLYKELGLDAPGTSDAQVLDALLAHPILIERPLVETGKGVRLCRPVELVEELF